MRIFRTLFLLLYGGAAWMVPVIVMAQAVPVGGPIQLCDPGPGEGWHRCWFPATAALPEGRFAVAGSWDFSPYDFTAWPPDSSCWLLVLDPSGARVGGTVLAPGNPINDYLPDSPVLASYGNGLLAAWQVGFYGASIIQAQRFGFGLPPQEPWDLVPIVDGSWHWEPRIAADAAGRFVVAWHSTELVWLQPDTISVQAFDQLDQPATPLIRLLPRDTTGFLEQPRVAIDGRGRFTVLWKETTRATGAVVLRGQRFSRDGRPLGSAFDLPRVGLPLILPGGGLVVAWSDGAGLWLEPLDRGGHPTGPPVAVSPSAATPLDITADRHGNLALIWKEGDRFRARLFNRLLVAQGPAIQVSDSGVWFGASASLSDQRRLLVAWSSNVPVGKVSAPLFARLWKVSYDADACVRRGGRFLCDTAGDGGEPEAAIDFGNGQGREEPFLADWDGDGRDDPCLYRGRSFACDTDHDGGLAEAVSPRIGLPGDVPLLGDLDGDGRADPCVRRGRLLLCDRARDGGATDLRIDFGQPGETLLLGDVDGDGRYDPCLYKGRRFLCDTAHDGGAAEVVLDLRSVLHAAPGDVPLLGDVNGDGRGDACVWQSGRLLCGVFQARGGQPLRMIERSFGEAGDVPLLGDLDAF
jgi:hypothetical protein